jgi:hypothetical protein
MRARTIVGGVIVALGLLGSAILAPAAGAAPVVTADPAGDGHGSGDIRGQKMGLDNNTLTLQIRTQQPLNLDGAPAWSDGANTQLRFNIDVGNEPGVDYAAVIEPGPSGVTASLLVFGTLPSPRISCDPQITQPELTIIRARIPYGCFASPDYFQTFSRYRLDRGGDGSVNSDDRAPNGGYSGKIVIA